jgi:diguanylate cyclase (GGDEF)-like protein
MADGDYDVDLDYQGQDEVGVLTSSFRQMRDRLQIYISDLNSRAYKDALTGVKNKGAFHVSAGRLNDAIRMGEAQFAVVMFDCNRLKQVNDQYGHNLGDVYLRAACSAICRTYAHSPVFRMGGDEFVALLQYQDYENRAKLLEEFDRMAGETNAQATHPWQMVNVSKGMAVYQQGSDATVEEVLNRADELMYEDKRRYKNSLND